MSADRLGWGFWATWLLVRNLPYLIAFVLFVWWIGVLATFATAVTWTCIAHYEQGFDQARRAIGRAR